MITKVDMHRSRNRNDSSHHFSHFVLCWNDSSLRAITSPPLQCRKYSKKVFFLAGLYFFIGVTGLVKFFLKKGIS
jgi:hypothetical protein